MERFKSRVAVPVGRFLNKDTGITNTAWLVWGLLVFAVPFQLHYDHILNLFYHIGAGFGDSGLFAAVSWHNDFRLTTPIAYDDHNVSFFSIHFMPLLWILNLFSYYAPTYKPEYYGTYTAVGYGLLSVALFCVFHACVKAKNHLHLAFFAALCIAFAFNPAIIKGLWYVHVEYAMITSIFFFLYCYLRGYPRLSIFFLLLSVLEREDGGFHLACVIACIALVKWWETRSIQAIKRDAWFAGAAFSGGAIAWGITFLVRAIDGGRTQSTWELMYSGNPPFAHLNFALIWERLTYIFQERMYLWIGFWLTAVWAYWKREVYYLVGFCASLPWFFLNLISAQKMTGHFEAYYPFPFIIGLGWPLFAMLLRYGVYAPAARVREALILQTLLVLIGLVTWNYGQQRFTFGPLNGYGGYTLEEGARNRALVQQFVMQFDGGAGDLGDVRADAGMSSLIFGKYKGEQVLYWNSKEKKTDTLIYMAGNSLRLPKDVLEYAQKSRLSNNYCMSGTTICILTNRSYEQLGTLGSLVRAEPVDPAVMNAPNAKEPANTPRPSPKVYKGNPRLQGIDFDKLLKGR